MWLNLECFNLSAKKNSLYSPAGGYFCYFKSVHSSTLWSIDTKQDIYFGAIMGSVKKSEKLNACKYTSYTVLNTLDNRM